MGIDEQIATIERTLNNEAVGEAVKAGLRLKLEELKKQESGKPEEPTIEPEEPSESFEDKVRNANESYFKLVNRGMIEGKHNFIEENSIVEHVLPSGEIVLYEIMDDFTMKKVIQEVIRPEKPEDRPKRLSQLKRWLKERVGKPGKTSLYVIKSDSNGRPEAIFKELDKVQTNDFSLRSLNDSISWVEFPKAKDLKIDPYGFVAKGGVHIMYDKQLPEDVEKWMKSMAPEKKEPEDDPKVKQTSDFTYKGWRAVRDTISTTQGTLRLSKDGVKIDYGLGVSPANYEDGRKNPHFKTDEEIKEIIDMLIIDEPKARKMASFHNESWDYLLKLPRPEFNFKWQTYQDAMPKNEFINEVKKELINQYKMDRADAFKLVGSQNKNILDHWRNGKSHIDVATLLFANYKDLPGRTVKPELPIKSVDINEEFVLDIQDPKSLSGRKLTPYPKQKSDRYFWAWMKENALEEHKSDRYKRGLIEAIDLKNISPSDKTDLNLFLFGVENARITGHKKPKQSAKPKQTERLEKVISLWKGFDKEFNEKGLHSKTLNMPNEPMMKAFIDDFEKSGFKDKYYLTRNPIFKGKISITKRYSGDSYKGLTFDEYKYLAIVKGVKSAFRKKYFDKHIKTDLNSIKQSLADKGFLTAGKALNSKGSELVQSITVENFDRNYSNLDHDFEKLASKFGVKEKIKKSKGKTTVKIGDKEVDCDDLIEAEREKLSKRRKQSKEQSKKRESTKNIQRIDKATKKIETSIQERLENGKTLSKSEIDKLIKECEDLITKLKDYLKQIRR